MGRASQARVNVSENCYNPVCASCRGAEALGYARRSPPARAMADYLLKDHKPSLNVRKPLRGWRIFPFPYPKMRRVDPARKACPISAGLMEIENL
jgi:hypothetical protein